MAVNKGEIGIYGILRRDGGDGILAKTDQIQDDTLKKTQEQLNQEAVNGAALAAAHIANTNNPHNVTKAQVGLDKVTNDEQVKRTEMGKPLGVATLDGLGKVPSSQLPAYVDDVVEYETADDFPKYGESGKIYVETTTNLTYRWTGTQYIEISKSIGLGETASTAYPGDKGKQVADDLDTHIKDTTNPHNVTKEQIGLGNVDNTSDKDKPISTAQSQAISSVQSNLTSHTDDKQNPHNVTKDQVGLGKVDNTADSEKNVYGSNVLYGCINSSKVIPNVRGDLLIRRDSDDGSSSTDSTLRIFVRPDSTDTNEYAALQSGIDRGFMGLTQDVDCASEDRYSLLLQPYIGRVGIGFFGNPRESLDIHGNLIVTGNYYSNDGKIYAEAVSDTEIETMLNDLGI